MMRLREETGSTVVAALLVSIIVLGLGTAVLQKVNAESNQTAAERSREAAFQLTESALNATALQVARNFPDSIVKAFPTCTSTAAPSSKCTGTALAANFTNTTDGGARGGIDFNTTPQWQVRVIDDVNGPSYYDDSLATLSPAPPEWDSTGATGGVADGYVWVRASATVAGHNYVLVSLVGKGALRQEALPRNSVTAGWFATTNSGNKTLIDAKGGSAVAGTLAVRCATAAPATGDPCLGYSPAKGQLSPADAYTTNYVDGRAPPNATNRSALGAAALARIKAYAQSIGTYYPTGCPASYVGLVYVEIADCTLSGGTINSATAPGMLVFGSGTLTLGGSATYNGIIYMANGQGTAPASGPCAAPHLNSVLSTNGTNVIQGAVFIDKCGGYTLGTSALNLVFDANVFSVAVSNGASAVVKNSFRVVSSS